MAIIASFLKGESYGLLGPQMAATVIESNSSYDCVVIAVSRDDDKTALKSALGRYFGGQRPLIGFSALSGRADLFELAAELKAEGALTLLAGPQAGVDFSGETGWADHPHRFRGLAGQFDFALQGPAEQVIPLLDRIDDCDRSQVPGLLYRGCDGRMYRNPVAPWGEKFLDRVNWRNLFTLDGGALAPLSIHMGQVLQHIGCPHAARSKQIRIDYPAGLKGREGERVKLAVSGCSFCDVAADKGFHGQLNLETVIGQIHCLPEAADGRKIPFELINESPLPGLADLLLAVRRRGIRLSQINLTLRADWLAAGEQALRAALQAARETDATVLLSSIGFESFDDTILCNLNKGLSVEKNLAAIRLIRRLKEDFPRQLGYSSREGAIHGFIHPTPWDTQRTEAAIQKTIALYGLQNDILPPHSTPLIIHHASTLGDWIREIEKRESIKFKRRGTIVGWWETPGGT